MPDVIDAHDHRVHRCERILASVHERRKRKTDSAQHQDRDLQVGVHHERLAILFEIFFCCLCEIGLSHGDLHLGYSARATTAVTSPLSPLAWPPTWPEKRLAVMVGILSKTKPVTKHSIMSPGIM